MDARYIVDTPENIEFAYDVAGIGSRFLAAIVDTLLIVLVQILILVVFAIVIAQVDAPGSPVTSILTGIGLVLSFIFLWGFYIFFELFWNGQSPGKRLVGVRVVREGGRPITFVASAIRNLVRFIDFLPAFYGLGVVVMFIDKRARRLGDLAGGTLVVKERGAVSLDSLTAHATAQMTDLPASDEPVTLQIPNLHRLTDDDYNLVQEFLRRRKDLGRESRFKLGAQLADGLRARLDLPPDIHHEPFLEHVAYEYRLSQRQNTRSAQ